MIDKLINNVLIKDFGSFKESDWLLFGNYDEITLKNLMRDRHLIQADWEPVNKFGLRALRISFRYESDQNFAIIEAMRSYHFEGNKILETTQIPIEECFIDRSFYNNNVQVSITDEDFNLLNLYKRIFKETGKYDHKILKKEFLDIDSKDNIDYVLQYEYINTTLINTGMGVKKFLNGVASTGETEFVPKLTKMLEDNYTKPLLNKSLSELTDADILVLEMNNT